jgi:hypothetical protein
MNAMELNENLAIMFGLFKTDDIDKCIENSYGLSKLPYTTKQHWVYRGLHDIYPGDYSTWNPVADLDQAMMVVEHFQSTRDFINEVVGNCDSDFHTSEELAFILCEKLIEKYYKDDLQNSTT